MRYHCTINRFIFKCNLGVLVCRCRLCTYYRVLQSR